MNIFGTVLPILRFATYMFDEEDGYEPVVAKLLEFRWLGFAYGFVYKTMTVEEYGL